MELGTIQLVDINEEMREAYLDYAMSVIIARALPDARDGLKPVQRRILYAMHELGLRPDTPYKKSARIVGEVLGKYHPHGDQAVYDAMVRMAQDFSLRYMLVDGQGNFGSIDGDNAAAMRYTEARTAEIGVDMMADIAKNTVDYTDNFDGTLQEPAVLPSAVPNLLVNGASGIAVGMSTNVPPHNLGEVCDALVYLLKHWDGMDDIGVADLMQFIKGPDFPTGGVVFSGDGGEGEADALTQAYATGRGKVKVRAKVHVEEWTRGRSRIIVSEIPYQTNKTSLIERVAQLVREARLEGITELRDESDRQGLRIVFELSRTADPAQVLEDLFRQTPLESTQSIIILALVDGEPRTLSLKQALRVYLDHRLEIVRRRSEYDLARAKARAHILEGLLTALDNLDAVIDTIRRSRTVQTARTNLQKNFSLSEAQAQAILEMQLRRLAALERRKLQDEHKELVKFIAELEKLLKSPALMRQAIIDELAALRDKYADPRRTAIVGGAAVSPTQSDTLMPAEDVWVTLTAGGKLSRTFTAEAPKVTTTMPDPPGAVLESNSRHILYLFTADGQAASLPVHQLPQAEDPAEGQNVYDLAPLAKGAEITAALSLPPSLETGFLFFATAGGDVKRVRLEDLPGASATAFTVMNIKDDRMGWVRYVVEEDEILLATAEGQVIRFKVAEVRPTGLRAGGMRGIKLMGQRDAVVGMDVANDKWGVWTITANGEAKITSMDNYNTQGRAGSGAITMKLSRRTGPLAGMCVGRADDKVVVITNKDKPKYMRLGLAPRKQRATTGGSVVSLRTGEAVVGIVPFLLRLDVLKPDTDET
ncbi:MAG: DNA gyrase subunit A [Anaerolineae bacterium]|nr:DNA gyrase subunit A [Anaerolineae bacterium]